MAVIRRDAHHCDTNMSGQGYQIAATSKAFEALISGLYTKKPEAVARENICNADDAHKERDRMYPTLVCGYQHSVASNRARADYVESVREERKWFAPLGTPYRIHAPSSLEPWFEVYDNGIGLNVDQVLGEEQHYEDVDEETGETKLVPVIDDNGHPVRSGGMYTTMFASTKELVNDQIGAFGLGAKSGFAISDTFTVECRVNGEKHIYIMYMDSERKPNVTWVTKDKVTGKPAPLPTDEYNGVSVRIPVEPEMFDRMKHAIEFTLSTMESEVELENMWKCEKIERTFRSGQTFIQLKSNPQNRKRTNMVHYAVQGGVAYPIELKSVADLPMHDVLSVLPYDTYTFFDIGEINVPPSREYLTYDKFTLEALNRRTVGMKDGLDRIIIDACVSKLNEAACDNMWQTWKVWKECKDTWGDQLGRETWHSALHEVFDEDIDPKMFAKNASQSFPQYTTNGIVGTRINDEGEQEDVMGDRTHNKYTVESYRKNCDQIRRDDNKPPQDIRLDEYSSTVIMICNRSRDYIKRLNHAFLTFDLYGRNSIRLVRMKPETSFPTVKDRGENYGQKELELQFENLIPVINLDELEIPKSTYSERVSSGVSRYTYGTSTSSNSWAKLTPKDVSECLESDKKHIYVMLSGFTPNIHSMSNISKTQAMLDDMEEQLKEMGVSPRIIGMRKSSMRIMKEHPHQFVEMGDFINELVESAAENEDFRKYCRVALFDKYLYDSQLFTAMAVTSLMRNDKDTIGHYRQFAMPAREFDRRWPGLEQEFPDTLSKSVRFKSRYEKKYSTIYEAVVRGRDRKDLRQKFPWMFRIYDFWFPLVNDFKKNYPRTVALTNNHTIHVTSIMKEFEIDDLILKTGFVPGQLIDTIQYDEKLHKNDRKFNRKPRMSRRIYNGTHIMDYVRDRLNTRKEAVQNKEEE